MIRRPAVSVSAAQLEIASKSPYAWQRWYQSYPLVVERVHYNMFRAERAGILCFGLTRDAAAQHVNKSAAVELGERLGKWGWK